jgi:mRNA interferase RelE/StbE
MAYAVQFAPAAEREFRKLSREIQRRLRPRIDGLAVDPRPADAKKLKGHDDLWRIRTGDYRIVYEIWNEIPIVLVVHVAHRREAYR